MLLLLLNCSFSQPYTITFLDNCLTALDLFELLVPVRYAAINDAHSNRAIYYKD